MCTESWQGNFLENICLDFGISNAEPLSSAATILTSYTKGPFYCVPQQGSFIT
jgi:hypothetical protein